jgi:hypothetical protein
MRKLKKLKRQAKSSAEFHGHTLGPWKSNLIFPTRTRAVELSICIHCGEWVAVDTRPLPNGINVGGTAVAMECKKHSLHCVPLAAHPAVASNRT